MSENTSQDQPSFEIDELDDNDLEGAAGGTDVNAYCPIKNTCNTVAGCGTTTPGATINPQK